MKVHVKSPTRVDLAGGTLDLWPIYNFLEKPKTVNLAIDIYTECSIQSSKSLNISAKEISYTKNISDIDSYLNKTNNLNDFIYPHIKHFRPSNLDLSFSSQSPIGAGLGGSSSLTISILNAFYHWNKKTAKTEELVYLAHNMESYLLKTPTGTQDYYPPILGGMLALHHNWNGCKIEKLNYPDELFKDHFLLVYTGKPHHSGLNNWQVLKDVVDGNLRVLNSLKALNNVANQVYQACLNSSWDDLPNLFKEEYKYRTEVSSTFTSSQIQEVEDIARLHNAKAVKICGAGGGGCVFIWLDPDSRKNIIKALKESGFMPLEAMPTRLGAIIEEK